VATERATARGDGYLSTEHLLLGLAAAGGETADLLAIHGATEPALAEALDRDGLDSNVSVKVTALGLKLGYDLCRENLVDVVAHAAERGNFVRIDMEHSGLTDRTLGVYRGLREAGHDRIGVALQAYLRRTMDDVHALADLAPSVRVVKGIYVEPAEIAYKDPAAINGNFVRILDGLLSAGSYVAIATHDRTLIEEVQPVLSLHGHIHESKAVAKIGKTTCVNPGSAYSEGVIDGAVIDLRKDRVRSCQLVTG